MGKAFSPLCLALIVAFAGSSCAADPRDAADPTFEPFRFEDGATRFTSAVRFPYVADDFELELRCEAWFR
tara:strand:- start:312 stop:521 length:210 start_codon:yes stop_codon:yes gene_type:complete